MKSKAFILRQISELLEKNRGLCDIEIQEWIKENENMTVYELLTFKKELSKTKEFQDVSFMRWFRDEES
jgi:TFIIF-interacting CTD phosphatase-like protein|tara:strand:+ start:387 stop:593 length:207 start_codon:yes stop_codon:yes gene_type:complete